jgi:hypothetical protein
MLQNKKSNYMKTKPTIIKTEDFRKWLHSEFNLPEKVCGDIASRAKRVAKWVSFEEKGMEDKIVEMMMKKASVSLKSVIISQLKRAVRLYRQFSK